MKDGATLKPCEDCGVLVESPERWCEDCFEKGLHKDMNDHFDNFIKKEMEE